MSENRADPRVLRTRQLLRDGMIALTLQKGYDAVNIQDITAYAGVRRATFYLHFRDKDELLLSMLKETVDALMLHLSSVPIDALTPESTNHLHLLTFQHVMQHVDLYRAILTTGQGALLIHRHLRDYLIAKLRPRFQARGAAQQLSVPLEVLANFIASLILSMLTWWLEKGVPYTPEQMAVICTQLELYGIAGVYTDSP